MKLEDRLASLQPHPPTDDEIAHLLATADRRTRRRRTRIAAVAAVATVVATATFAALPTSQAPTADAILTSTAQTAAAQDAPAPWTGYRYAESLARREHRGYTVERHERWWSDSRWQGRSTSTAKLVDGTIVAPTPPPGAPAPSEDAARRYPGFVLADRDFRTPEDMPDLYGDGALADVPLSELPTDPDRLGRLLFEAQRDGRWTPGGGWDPAADRTAYEVLRATLTLLTRANVTPAQRAALITTLTRYEGAAPLPEAHDRRGRAGRGVMIAGVTIIFDPATSEVLEWSQRGETHTFLAAAQVEKIGDTR
jgi:hypothetical protein